MRQFGELEAVIMHRLWGRGRPPLVREMVNALQRTYLTQRRCDAGHEAILNPASSANRVSR